MSMVEDSKARVLLDSGRYREALGVLESLIDESDEPGELYYWAAHASLALGDASGASDYFLLASTFLPQEARVWLGLGRAAKASGAMKEAVGYFERAAALQPDAPTLAALGLAQLRAGSIESGAAACERACTLDPDCVEAWHHRGLVERERGGVDAARGYFERALSLRPELIEVRSALAHALRDLGRSAEALAHYDAVLQRDPGFVDALLNRSQLLLMEERYGEGWDAYDARLAFPDAPRSPVALPAWAGQPGARVLVYGEQGIGDQVMFASCLPDLAARASAVTLVCHPKLVTLFQRSFGGMVVHSRDEPAAMAAREFQAAVALASLPRIFRRSRDAFPRHGGYLAATPEDTARWSDRFAKGPPGPRIGLCWRGGSLQTRGHLRSILPEHLSPLAGAGAVRWISLQYGDSAADCTAIRRAGLAIDRWPEIESDLEACTAAIAALDLVITIDNTIAHLAGALGKVAWILLSNAPEWRYGLERDALPWYPQARLFRQRQGDTWAPVLAAVASALKAGRAGEAPA